MCYNLAIDIFCPQNRLKIKAYILSSFATDQDLILGAMRSFATAQDDNRQEAELAWAEAKDSAKLLLYIT